MNKDWELNHVGLMVTGREKTLEYFQSLGIGVSVGPQPLMPHIEGQGSLMIYTKLYSDPITFTYKTGGAHTFFDGESQIGDCQLECYGVEPVRGTFIEDYINTKGEGINHVCFNVLDVEGETRKLEEKGCVQIFRASVNDQTIENFIDTRKYGDVLLSLRPPASDWEKAWQAHNQSYPLVNDWQFKGLGVAVKDLEKTIEFYKFLKFEMQSESELDSVRVADFKTTGNTNTAVKTRAASFSVGPISFEFVQPIEGDSVYQESMENRGEGVNCIAFLVKDLEKETARLTIKGAPVLMSGKPSDSAAFAYFNTRERGNMMVKLIQC
jgi:methylmalonyl-CoA/ethylmalonyl-CoA epimerase